MSELIAELVEFLISRGHSKERAHQIAGNHPEAVRAEMEVVNAEKTKKEEMASETPAPESSAE